MREYQCWYKEKNETPSPITTALKRVMNKITVAKCRKYLRIERFDIVHVNALTAYVVGKAAILENIPVVWHIREFMEEDLGISFVSREYSLELLNRATQFIAISQPICNSCRPQLRLFTTVFRLKTTMLIITLYMKQLRFSCMEELFQERGSCSMCRRLKIF